MKNLKVACNDTESDIIKDSPYDSISKDVDAIR
jgi:hypothetical protein